MRGLSRHPLLASGARFLGPGTVRGRLLDLGRYPGLVPGAGRVQGELYRIDRAELLPVLDREEGYNFQRRWGLVSRPDGCRVRAWLYRYCGARGRGRPIPTGCWRASHGARQRHP
jgi:gamma-glutamylcyclotransferase (GGCT)/AIG2-like uncharacterized protein YtfP